MSSSPSPSVSSIISVQPVWSTKLSLGVFGQLSRASTTPSWSLSKNSSRDVLEGRLESGFPTRSNIGSVNFSEIIPVYCLRSSNFKLNLVPLSSETIEEGINFGDIVGETPTEIKLLIGNVVEEMSPLSVLLCDKLVKVFNSTVA